MLGISLAVYVMSCHVREVWNGANKRFHGSNELVPFCSSPPVADQHDNSMHGRAICLSSEYM